MAFHELLKEILKKLKCTQANLSTVSGLSKSVISRYLSGERQPAINSKQFDDLCQGLEQIAKEKEVVSLELSSGITVMLTSSDLSLLFSQVLETKDKMYSSFSQNFDALITTTAVNMKTLASSSNFDVSYLYRVRSGERHPANLQVFCETIGAYFASNYNDGASLQKMATLLGCSISDLDTEEKYIQAFCRWLIPSKEANQEAEQTNEQMQHFLHQLDEFDLDEYMRSIHFHDLKVPSMPFHLTVPKTYYGVEQMKKGELDFFKSTVLSKSKEPIFMCSDMPMEDMAEDMDFNKKWMFGIAMALKKGHHLNIIHNIDRPFQEMMLGLEAWIPIYMTGQVSPYHFPKVSTDIYHHFNYVSDNVALTGECIHGYHDHGKYYLTSNKEEVNYCKRKAKDMLSHAQPLMNIYRQNSKKSFIAFERSTATIVGKRHNTLTSLPLYTMPVELLEQMVAKTSLPENRKKEILSYAKFKRNLFTEITTSNVVVDEIFSYTEEEFEAHPMVLAVSELFLNQEITYTYEEYQAHLKATKQLGKKQANYTVTISEQMPFRNIQMQVVEGNYVQISKSKAPAIQFVIRHPKMVSALQNFKPVV